MRAGLALVVMVLLTACASYPVALTRDDLPDRQQQALDDKELGLIWHQHDAPQAVVVLVHGLNLEPTAMMDIEQALFASDMDVLSVSLSGHSNALATETRLLQFQETRFVDWQADMRRAVGQASQRAEATGKPLYLVGFSLGGLLSADYLTLNPQSSTNIERMVLFAPALSLRWSSYLLYPLQVFPYVFLPSVAPIAYRANNYAPVSAYTALYEGVRAFNERAGPALDVPTLVFMHPGDELVSADGVQEFMVRHALHNWHYESVTKSEDAGDVLNHLIIGPHSLGEQAWQNISGRMLEFLTPD